jgi:hypothetical protein
MLAQLSKQEQQHKSKTKIRLLKKVLQSNEILAGKFLKIQACNIQALLGGQSLALLCNNVQ